METKESSEQFFCRTPFERLELHSNGKAWLCCPAWMEKPIGDWRKSSLLDLWNGDSAQEIRKSMLDGSFRFCKKNVCPHFQNKKSYVTTKEAVSSPYLQDIIKKESTILDRGPSILSCSYDPTCNLSCPSCRTKVLVLETDGIGHQSVLKIQADIYNQLKDVELIKFSGYGDPLASRYYSEFLESLNSDDFPKLRIYLMTNGILLTPQRWERLKNISRSIQCIDISIDAADEETYAKNRRGGKFAVLLENLRFIGQLRKENKIAKLTINFVIQSNNWKTMSAFVQLGQSVGVDFIQFSRILNWGTFSEEEFKARDVQNPNHPEHAQFIEELKNPLYKNDKISFGNFVIQQ